MICDDHLSMRMGKKWPIITVHVFLTVTLNSSSDGNVLWGHMVVEKEGESLKRRGRV